MTFKRPLSISPASSSINNTQNMVCKVCGDKAFIKNYSALSCPSCKIFFRRHGFHPKNTHQCHFNANCQITVSTRRMCTACRFAKCLAIGMNPELIRKEDLSKIESKRKQLMTTKSFVSVFSTTQLSKLDFLSNDLSSLSTSNWTLLSNVIHAFDKFIPITQTRDIIQQISSSVSSLLSDKPPILSMLATFYTSTELFISSSADFQILTLDEKSSLYQRNLHGVLHLCATFIYQLSGMFQHSTSDQIIISIYGYDVFQQTKRIALQLDYDITITKLLLLILAFSSNCYMVDTHENMQDDKFLHGTFRLFGSQNVYVEVLWKYLIYRYDYYDASLRFARQIKHILDLLKLSGIFLQNNTMHRKFLDKISRLSEQSLIINENEVIRLWGKS